jgi:hypothetical protein
MAALIEAISIKRKMFFEYAAKHRFLVNVRSDDVSASPITIVQNWTVGLKK